MGRTEKVLRDGHLADGELSDYVRGLVLPDDRFQIETHLSGCAKCMEMLSFFQRVHTSVFVPASPLPPGVVAQAKGLFQAAYQQKPSARRVFAIRILGDAGIWAPVGVRSALQLGTAKQAAYEWTDYCVDLRSELQPDTVQVSLVGQIVSKKKPNDSLESVHVRLLTGQRTIHQTKCNRLGEFCLSYVPERRLGLEIDIQANVTMVIPLDDLKIAAR